MNKRSTSSDKTQIGAPSRTTERIPERYQASLVIVGGHSSGMEYTLTTSYSVIGRDKEADIMLKDPLVSRQQGQQFVTVGNAGDQVAIAHLVQETVAGLGHGIIGGDERRLPDPG